VCLEHDVRVHVVVAKTCAVAARKTDKMRRKGMKRKKRRRRRSWDK
jgi:hypothetical protein